MEDLLLIDKPAGMTSHDVVDRVRKIAKTRRVGHAGTLDPFATGLLIVGVNAGTKKLTALVGLDKTYVATARLGATSTTDDPEGEINISDGPIVGRGVPRSRSEGGPPRQDEIDSILDRFRGGYDQTVPAFSAKKVGGKKLYELARKGKAVALPVKHVTISELEILDYAWPELTFRVSCGSGTYIRALARDIGEALGCGAYLTALRRTRIGPYAIEQAETLEGLPARIR